MASWVGPTVAIAMVVIALCIVALAVVAFSVVREARAKTDSLANELAQLRSDLAPSLVAINHLTESSAELVERISGEAEAVLATSRRVRQRVARGMSRAEDRLADLDAIIEVATDEAEAALLDASTALQSLRTGAGLLSHVGRFLLTREDSVDDESLDEEAEADEEEEADEQAETLDEGGDEAVDAGEPGEDEVAFENEDEVEFVALPDSVKDDGDSAIEPKVSAPNSATRQKSRR